MKNKVRQLASRFPVALHARLTPPPPLAGHAKRTRDPPTSVMKGASVFMAEHGHPMSGRLLAIPPKSA